MISEKLLNQKKYFEASANVKVLKTFNDFQLELEKEREDLIYPNVGDVFPDFKLKNAVGQVVTLTDKLRNGPIVISFYRGEWCPYCNIELKGYEAILNDIRNAGGDFIAISPELPDLTISF